MKYHFKITVTGRGDFPLDMLRYSQCYPSAPIDVENIASGIGPGSIGKRAVTVCMDRVPYALAQNCIDRFKSFGWDGVVTFEERV